MSSLETRSRRPASPVRSRLGTVFPHRPETRGVWNSRSPSASSTRFSPPWPSGQLCSSLKSFLTRNTTDSSATARRCARQRAAEDSPSIAPRLGVATFATELSHLGLLRLAQPRQPASPSLRDLLGGPDVLLHLAEKVDGLLEALSRRVVHVDPRARE